MPRVSVERDFESGLRRYDSYSSRQKAKETAAAEAARKATEAQQAQNLAAQQAADEERRKKEALQAEANKYLDLGKMSKQQEASIEALRRQAEGQDSYSMAMAKKLQERAAKQQMAMAYARGYNPAAIRGAQMAGAEAQAGIAAEAEQAKLQEQAQSRQLYTQALEYKQKMALASQEAYNAFLSGKTQEALQMQKMAQDYELGLQGVQAQRESIAQQASASKRSFWGGVLGGVLTAGGAVGGAFLGGPAGAMAGAAAGGALGQAVSGGGSAGRGVA